MATNEELEKMIKQLSEQVASLQDGFEKFQALLTQIVETKQLTAEAIESTNITASNNQGLRLGANTRASDIYIDPSGNVGFGVTQPLNSLHVARSSHLNAVFDRTDTSDHLTVVVGSDGSGLRFSDSNFFFIGTQPYNERNDNSAGRELFRITSDNVFSINGLVRGSQEGGSLRIGTNFGYLDMGPMNSDWSHFQTDRSRFYFNQQITVDSGNISSYDEDLTLMTQGTPRVTIRRDTGNVGIGIANPGYTLDVEGTLGVGNRLTLRGDPTIQSPGRMHIAGEELLFLLNKDGVIVGKHWGGNGNLSVQGNLAVEGEIQGKPWYSQEFSLAVPIGGSVAAVKMLPANKCFAFITSVAGSFAGGGERVWVEVRSDGFWYLCGHALQPQVSAKARCVGMP